MVAEDGRKETVRKHFGIGNNICHNLQSSHSHSGMNGNTPELEWEKKQSAGLVLKAAVEVNVLQY